jgi:hypothetical protein
MMIEPLTDNELEEMRWGTEDLGELLYGGVRKAMLRLFATIDIWRAQANLRGVAGDYLAAECANVDASLTERAGAVIAWNEAAAKTPEEALAQPSVQARG